jgi:peptidylprolyl isomerase/FKBP-type peptidyl-prolyl cis-trans isomerase FkpA
MNLKLCYILVCLMALLSCTAESVKNSLLRQEQDIERYINTLKNDANNPADTVYNLNGVYRVVLDAGAGEGAAPGDSVVFDYEAYVFASGKGDMYDAGRENKTLGSGSYFAGLETGLTGMLAGEHAQIILAGDKGYGNVPMGVLPPNTPLIFEIWMYRVVKQ